ncbi:hypothetical protein [Streptomyces purpureus]|uniref:Uncharacterized protein n=1 Tax=Streptomyces purpureus TaxID=1951 RepID=A0A918H0V0_9ACTN|nr:hypothetical protein [Streptomyces purpureus]GGT29992.1 hypothetical protein GCM10014713_24440 [Streptomyces purpureus]
MKATISWWDLSGSEQTIDSLRDHLRAEGVEPWAEVQGLRLKFWISDRETNRWGAVMLWDSAADLKAPMPPNRATELIGYPPTDRMATDVEAIVEGAHSGRPAGRGLAFEPIRKAS